MEDQSLPDADLLAYPSVEESVAAWNGGFDEARAMAISLGINSVENGGNVPNTGPVVGLIMLISFIRLILHIFEHLGSSF